MLETFLARYPDAQLADHAQYPGLGYPSELKPLDNPNPRRLAN